jgi:O-antigen/teichoic acid export membrane protein
MSATGSTILHVLRNLKVQPDLCTAEGRSHERYRRAAMTSATAILARAVSLVAGLVSVPLTVAYLGDERYGMWATITSLISMLGFADLGMGNGLVNVVSDATGRNDNECARRATSSTFFWLSGVGALIIIAVIAALNIFPWSSLFNVQTPLAIRESGPTAAVMIACFAAALPLTVVQKVQLGIQQGFASNVWQVVGSVLGLLALLLAIGQKASLPVLVFAFTAAPLVALALNGYQLFWRWRPDLRPRLSLIDTATSWHIARTGFLFLGLQLAGIFAYSSDSIIAAQVLGPEHVTEYSIGFKLFMLATNLQGMLVSSLWPAYGEAMARGDRAWVRRAVYHSLWVSVALTGAASTVLLVFRHEIFGAWVGPDLVPSLSLSLSLTVWSVMNAVGGTISTFLSGTNQLGIQLKTATALAVLTPVLKILLCMHIGVSGVVWATVIVYGTVVLPIVAIHTLRCLRGNPQAAGAVLIAD